MIVLAEKLLEARRIAYKFHENAVESARERRWFHAEIKEKLPTLIAQYEHELSELAKQSHTLLAFVERTATDISGGNSVGYHCRRIRLEAAEILRRIGV